MLCGSNKKSQKKLYFELNVNDNETYWNSWFTFYSVLKGKFIASNTYVSKVERSPLNDQSFYLKEL